MDTDMQSAPLCQSCSMPLTDVEDFGTNADGGVSEDYCQYCFQNGVFTEPEITVDEMIEKCVAMMKHIHLQAKQIEQARMLIPTLKRWR